MQCPSHNETIEKTLTYYIPNISSDFTLNLNLSDASDLIQTLSICIIPDDESNFNIDDYRISIEADGITKEVDSNLNTDIDVYRQEYDVDIRVIVENKNNTSLIHEDIITLPQLDEPYIYDSSWEEDAQYNIDLSTDGDNGNMEIILYGDGTQLDFPLLSIISPIDAYITSIHNNSSFNEIKSPIIDNNNIPILLALTHIPEGMTEEEAWEDITLSNRTSAPIDRNTKLSSLDTIYIDGIYTTNNILRNNIKLSNQVPCKKLYINKNALPTDSNNRLSRAEMFGNKILYNSKMEQNAVGGKYGIHSLYCVGPQLNGCISEYLSNEKPYYFPLFNDKLPYFEIDDITINSNSTFSVHCKYNKIDDITKYSYRSEMTTPSRINTSSRTSTTDRDIVKDLEETITFNLPVDEIKEYAKSTGERYIYKSYIITGVYTDTNGNIITETNGQTTYPKVHWWFNNETNSCVTIGTGDTSFPNGFGQRHYPFCYSDTINVIYDTLNNCIDSVYKPVYLRKENNKYYLCDYEQFAIIATQKEPCKYITKNEFYKNYKR